MNPEPSETTDKEIDIVESIVPDIHWVLPLAGAVNIFLIAFIAVYIT